MKKFIWLILLLPLFATAQQLAFPSAIGAGAYATGGRGGVVCHVNTLEWNPTGSYTYDASTNSYSGSFYELFFELDVPSKTIVFDVSGTISVPAYTVLNFATKTNKGNITVAGQTSTNGVVFETDYFQIQNIENLIWRYSDFYNIGNVAPGADVLWMSSATGERTYNVIFDHCSFFYGGDECLSIASSTGQGEIDDVTVQYCLMAASSKGSIVGAYVGDSDATTARTAYVDISYRFPNMLGYNNSRQDAINIFVENYTSRLIRITGDGNFNIQNMYVQANRANYGRQKIQYQATAPLQYHSSGLVITQGVKEDPSTSDFPFWQAFAGSSIAENSAIPSSAEVASPMTLVGQPFTIYPTLQVKDSVVPFVGNYKALNADGTITERSYPLTSYYKDRAINQVSTSSQQNYPAERFPTITAASPYLDTDKDGIPDTYEDANGTDKGDSADGATITASGYSNLEIFLNEVDEGVVAEVGPDINVTAVTVTPTSGTLQINQTQQLSVGFTPSNATDLTGVWSSSNGAVATVSQSGVVTALAEGSSTIAFTSNDSTNGVITDTFTITVIAEIVNNFNGSTSKSLKIILINN